LVWSVYRFPAGSTIWGHAGLSGDTILVSLGFGWSAAFAGDEVSANDSADGFDKGSLAHWPAGVFVSVQPLDNGGLIGLGKKLPP
jgi:hypothetical protein